MYLIADGGATKTDWALVEEKKLVSRVFTLGINPFHASEEKISQILTTELIPQLPGDKKGFDIYFYGAGCTPEKCVVMKDLLQQAFPDSKKIEVLSDLWGAARALCGHRPGIACILGTGSNSCYYDGKDITENTPPLGYILGDEGSGAVLGKLFVADVLKGRLSARLTQQFFEETHMTKADFLDNIYKKPMPSRFLASMVPFITKHKEEEPALRKLAVQNFKSFFSRCIAPYNHPELPVNFIGGLAFSYGEELKEAASAEGFTIGTILKGPMDGLLKYHEEASSSH